MNDTLKEFDNTRVLEITCPMKIIIESNTCQKLEGEKYAQLVKAHNEKVVELAKKYGDHRLRLRCLDKVTRDGKSILFN